MKKGKCQQPLPSLQTIREKFEENFSKLPDAYKSISHHIPYPVRLSDGLKQLQANSSD
jgi:hypothetical protein